MKKLLFIFYLFVSLLKVSAQSESFEGTLVYGRKFYNSSKRIDTYDPNMPPSMSFTIKGNLSLVEIITEKDFMTAMNYSVIKDSDKKVATMLARIANHKMAVEFDPSYFSASKLYKVIPTNETKTSTIAGLTCHQGYALIESEFGTVDTMLIWYTEAYNAIPFQFETFSSPGLIVSMQQDDISYWELEEIRKEIVDPLRFVIPNEFKPTTQNEMQDFISTMEQLDLEEKKDPMEMRGNEITHEEEN